MKRILLLVITLFGIHYGANAQQMLVGSYNIRYYNRRDSINGDQWKKRCQVITDQVNFMAPDIFGAQEVLHLQLGDLLKGLDGYDYIGVGRDDGKTAGEYAVIFYKKDHIKLLDSGHFWLSETPDRPSIGWDAACIRICTWGLFKDIRTHKKFYFFNLHMDHVGRLARLNASELVIKNIQQMCHGLPVILTGDFNVDQNDELYRKFTLSGLLKDTYHATRLRFAENGTFNNFKTAAHSESRIDHVFVSPKVNVDAYGILTDNYWTLEEEPTAEKKDADNGNSKTSWKCRIPSDHYPVFVRIVLQ